MKFDLFDALNQMTFHFGFNSDILVSNEDNGIGVRLSVYMGKDVLHREFVTNNREMKDCYVDVMNLRFKECIQELKAELKNYE